MILLGDSAGWLAMYDERDKYHPAARRSFNALLDQQVSFTDCTSFAVMHRERLVDAFTFDHHFEQMGFRLWPGGK